MTEAAKCCWGHPNLSLPRPLSWASDIATHPPYLLDTNLCLSPWQSPRTSQIEPIFPHKPAFLPHQRSHWKAPQVKTWDLPSPSPWPTSSQLHHHPTKWHLTKAPVSPHFHLLTQPPSCRAQPLHSSPGSRVALFNLFVIRVQTHIPLRITSQLLKMVKKVRHNSALVSSWPGSLTLALPEAFRFKHSVPSPVLKVIPSTWRDPSPHAYFTGWLLFTPQSFPGDTEESMADVGVLPHPCLDWAFTLLYFQTWIHHNTVNNLRTKRRGLPHYPTHL